MWKLVKDKRSGVERKEKVMNYLKYSLIPSLASSNMPDLAASLEEAVIRRGPGHIAELPLDQRERLKDVLTFEFGKLHFKLLNGDIDEEAYNERKEPLVTLLTWLPDTEPRSSESRELRSSASRFLESASQSIR